jgi:hypothetical protein
MFYKPISGNSACTTLFRTYFERNLELRKKRQDEFPALIEVGPGFFTPDFSRI